MSLIVIRIVPQVATNPVSFKDVLAKLTIEAFDVSFTNVDKQPPGQSVGKALFVDAKGLTLGSSGLESATPPFYVSPGAPPIKNGIIQQIDLVQLLPLPDHYQLEAVGICVIEVDQPATFENLRLAVTLGGQTVPVTAEYFDVPLVAGTTPDPAGFGTSSSGPDTPDAWGALAPSIYLQLPASLPSGSASTLQLSADGTPPAFADLLAAVQKVLQGDPGISVTVQPNVTATAGDTKLQFAPDSAGIGTGMNVSAAGIPAGTTVLGIDNTDPTHLVVTLNQELSATVDSTTAITFTPDLGALSLAQCKNVAYEIVWSQQPPQLPSPPEPPEDLYTDPPNTGPMLTGSTPNPHEGDRQQFEAQLKSYYTIANATADRLTSFVFTLSAAIACQQRSLAATQVLIEFPADPAAGSANDVAVVLSGVGQAAPANFGVPAAYFYALATSMPPQMAAQQRYALATRESLTGLLSDLTTAINAGIVTASESFTAAVLGPSPAAGKPNAAQAARRLTALNISAGAATPLAPLDTIALPTSVDADSGSTLTFVSVAGVSNGMSIGGANIVPGTTVKSFDPATRSVTLSAPILNKVPARSSIVFTPFWSTELQSLVQFWLAFPPTPPGGAISSLSYQPGDDDSQFWPGAANNANAPPTAGAVLNLVLCALTQGAMLPAPFTGALGDAIVKSTTLGAPKTVAELAKVTVQQWTQFFQDNPTWLPDFTQPGDTTARIAAFIRTVQKFFDVDLSGPSSPFVLATSAATDGGNNVLHFLPTKAIVAGMSVSGQRIPSGTTVKNLPPSATGDTDVELTQKVTGTVPLPAHTNVTFSLTVVSGPGAGTPALPLAKDWFTDCISAYDAVPPAYILGNGFDDQPKLQAAAEQIFRGDRSAQAWLVEALNTLDALYKVMLPVSITVADAEAYRFSVVEALYARGFTSPARINELTAAEFKQALAGTVAYDLAGDIQTSPASATSSGGTFQPVNPDGALTNCIPPPCSSPLGPVAYLSGLLNLSAISTCESPFAEGLALKTKGKATLPLLHFVSTTGVIKGMSVNGTSTVDGTTVASVTPTSVTLQPPVTGDVPDNTTINFTAPTLASALGGRRGPLADLVASCANLGTPLPLIDIANECLEYMASQVIGTRPVHGQVYETSDDKLADHVLCQHEPCPDEAISGCHDPARLFAALPEYSTPAVPVSANETVEPRVWNTLKSDFSACRLPYSQALDVSRSYLRHFGSCRFEEMRTFRKCITEFVLKPDNEPQGFADYLWRYPVRIDIAREYLGITPEEYAQLFAGAQAPRCSKPVDDDLPTLPATIGAGGPWQLFGFASPGGENNSWIRTVVQLPEFLARTCLTYCEFYELWQSEFVRFLSNDEGQNGAFPQCEPCCLDAFSLRFPDTERSSPEESLARLAVFIRLWRKLKESCCLCLTFAELRDVCDVLQLFNGSVPNPDFVRELAAFQMLREQFHLELYDRRDRPPPTAVDDHRTHILALWVGPTAKKWGWAIHELCDKIVLYARRRRGCEDRAGDFAAMLASHLDALSKLAGFDPASTTNNCNWHALPTHTLRFAEILAKVTESRFRIAELPYLFTATDDPSDCGPFPMQEECEAQELPLGLPDDETRFSLWRLRRELLAAADDDISPDGALVWRISSRADESDRCDPAEVGEQHRQDRDLEIEVEVDPNCRDWDWRRVATVLEEQLGFASGDVLALAQHFFPHVLERAGHPVDAAATRYISNLPVANTTPAMWAGRAGSPFQYDATAGGGQLWARIPIPDQEVIEQLTALQAFKFPEEQAAIQDLYFQPRAMLARFALLFPDSPEAQRHLIEEREGERRWHYFRRHVALCHRRCHIIAVHLSRHVAYATRQECPEDHHTALLILRELLADENAVQNAGMASWENDNGTRPTVTWNGPNSGAFAALLGLVGTGLVTEYRVTGTTGALVWRDISGALDGFGRLRDHDNAPLPTVLPSLAAKLPAAESAFLDIRNGFLLRPNDGDLVGGAQGFDVTWSGALLVEEEGNYEFWAGAPTPCGEKPDWEAVEQSRWRAVLKRGSRSWVILSHQWPGEEERPVGARLLRCGAYELTVEIVRPDPDFTSADRVRRVHAGLEIKYAGPDTCGERIALPRHRLFSIRKDHPLGGDKSSGIIPTQGAGAASYLATLYTSSLRDIRRTYQRAFKALLFAHRLGLRGGSADEGASELGFMLQNGANFAGASYFQSGGGYKQHLADFDFNFLPIADDYLPPIASADARAKPSPQRTQAMFDWWERLFDYTVARDDIRHRHDRAFWHLFAEAEKTKPANAEPLLAKLGIAPQYWRPGMQYFADQTSPVYPVTATDLEDERWGIRVWHAEHWLAALECRFATKEIGAARPDLWASDDPAAGVDGEKQTGNANLTTFVVDGCIEHGKLRRYDELRRLNDGLRQRGRDALLAWLCAMDRVALPWAQGEAAQSARDLSDLLLLDVETGLCERASRIEEAISAVQAFVRRARLHLEPDWVVSRAFAHLWDTQFATFEVWRACNERLLYKENWIEWDDLRRARGVEAFRTLEAKLCQSELAIAAPGGGDWWPGEPALVRRDPDLLQVREPSRMALLPAPHEGLDLLGTPDHAARPSWLALVPAEAGAGGGNSTPSDDAGDNAVGRLPLWMEAAVRLGTRFWRIAAGGTPPGAAEFAPHVQPGADDCVSCCEACGCEHPPYLDEYYFWLVPGAIYDPKKTTIPAPTGVTASGNYQDGYQDDFYDPVQQTSTVWQDPTQLAQLLAWPATPTVRLAWCRVHNGQFGQLRRSTFAVRVDLKGDDDLQFLGRTGDSLTFKVTNAVTPSGHADPSAPGFRYDIANDDAVVLPLVQVPETPPTFLKPLALPAYPHFLFFAPGAPLYPLSPFSPSLLIATALRAHCRFEAGLAWYREAFDPLQRNCTWVDCEVGSPSPGPCCDATDVTCDEARNRAVLLHYLETLVEWSDALRHRGNSPEVFQQAWALLDVAQRILGRPPRPVRLGPPAAPPTIAAFFPDSTLAQLNPRLVNLYETVADRLALIRTGQSARRLPDRLADGREFPYFGDDPVREGWRGLADYCGDAEDWCALRSPYRFAVLIQKAQDYAARVQEFGSAFQAAVEKGDAEFLAALRAGQEREILSLGIAAQEDTWRDADWAIEALRKTKAISQTNLNYYLYLIQTDPIGEEAAYKGLTEGSTLTRGIGETMDASSGVASAIGNYFTGVAGFGGTPMIYAQLPPGSPLAGAFAAVARILIAVSDVLGSTAGLNLTEAGWKRRLLEWNHQVDVLNIEIQQIERQILAAQRRRGKALKDLDLHQRQIEHAVEIQTFLRDKFTAPELYLYLQRETAALHRRMYELALNAARQAQHAFNLERGHTTRHFLPDCAWDDLHRGLLAGERLGLALRHMEKAYMDENVREHELTKHLSLSLHFPIAFLKLRATGCCEIDIPEWMFDLDYPGHFMRRIRNLTVTLPCLTGPFHGVHCRLTLLASMTRIDPRRTAPAHECCCPRPCCDECGDDEKLAREYMPCADDPRIVRQYGAREAIATSGGRDDSGMFQLDFNDQRYLPFEYMGAVSRWRIELPPENNYFDIDTLTDLVLRLGYTAREGGEPLREAAFAAARRHLPGNGWRFFDLRHDFADAWQHLRGAAREECGHARLRLCLERKMFPFIPHGGEITVEGMIIAFDVDQDDDDCVEFAGCPCPEPRRRATRRIEVRHCDDEHRDAESVLCHMSDEWPDLYCGVFEAEAALGGRRRPAEFDIRFGDGARGIGSVFLLCRYRTERCAGLRPDSVLDRSGSIERLDR